MWKPGGPKPAVTPKQKSTTATSPATDSATKKKLSGSTMNMRFMQKRNHQTPPPPPSSTEKRIHKGEEEVVDQDMAIDDDDEEEVMPADMYGTQSNLIGRRSFGGFKKGVERNWTDSLHYLNGDETSQKKSQKHVSDDELLKRYQDIVQGRGDRSGKKRRNSGQRPDGQGKKKSKR